MQNRDKLVDALKGYACFLVVFGHVLRGIRNGGGGTTPVSLLLENFIWTFHIQLFMFLSGYVYQLNGGWKSKITKRKFILHKLLNLGIPYMLFSVAYIIINSRVSSANTNYSLSTILLLWKKPVAQYWFLYALFWLFLIWTFLNTFLKNHQITILCVALVIIQNILGFPVGMFGSALASSLAFGIGTCCHKLNIDHIRTMKKLGIVFLHLVFCGSFVAFGIDDFVVINLEKLIGIAGSIAFISIIVKHYTMEQILIWINKYSFPIYLLHTIFTSCIRIILFKANIQNYLIHVIAGLFFGITIPVIGAFIARKSSYLDFFFYPSRTMKAISTRRIKMSYGNNEN